MRICSILLSLIYSSCQNSDVESPNDDPDLAIVSNKERLDTVVIANETLEPSGCENDSFAFAKIAKYVDQEMVEWRIYTNDEYDNRLFEEYGSHNDNFIFIDGDFNCDGITDYAIQLFKERSVDWYTYFGWPVNENKPRYHVVNDISVWVLTWNGATFSRELVLFEEDAPNTNDLGIVLIPKSTVGDMYTGQKVELNCDAIEWIQFESASRIYYHSDSGYQYVQTSD
jgi:hypothetical protein